MSNPQDSLQVAISLYKSKQFSKAISKLKKINLSDKHCSYTSLVISGSAYTKLNKFQKALSFFIKTLPLCTTKKEKTDTLNALGKCYYRLSQAKDAEGYFQQSLEVDSTYQNVEARIWLCRIYSYRKKFSEVRKLAPSLFNYSQYFIEAHLLLLDSERSSQNKSGMLSWLNKVKANWQIATEQEKVRVLFEYIRLNEFDSVEDCLASFTFKDPNISKVISLCLSFERKIDESKLVETLTDALIQSVSHLIQPDNLIHYRARAHDRIGNYKKAYDDFNAVANIQKEKSKHLLTEDIVDLFNKVDMTKLAKLIQESESNQDEICPVFFLGFPRSGTTLLDTIVDTQSNVKVISEGGFAGLVSKYFKDELQLEYPRDLLKLTSEKIKNLRMLYLEYLYEKIGVIEKDDVLIDKLPLYTIHIPLLLLLFPRAKFVFSVRHPMDVCISNFQQLYALNKEMARLLTLADCVKRYAQVFTLFEKYQSNLRFNVHFIKYEELVSDTDSQVGKLATFLNVTFDDTYKDFHLHSKNKVINTPSRSQVSQKLYKSSFEKWRNYEEFIDDHPKKLQPFIEKFGYSN